MKTKCENTVPVVYVEFIYIELVLTIQTFVSLFARRHGRRQRLRKVKTLQEVHLFHKAHQESKEAFRGGEGRDKHKR